MTQRRYQGLWPRFVTRAGASLGAGGFALLVASSAHAAHNACVQAMITDYVPSAPSSTVPGIVVGVTNGCGVADIYYFGYSNLSTLAPFTATTIMGIGSITKPFTATLVNGYATGQISTPGHTISVSDSINDYLPAANQEAPPNQKATITLQMLIDHTSGMPRDDSATSIATLYSQFDSATLLFTPGSSSSYSNFGYNVLGRLMETTLGTAYEDQVTSDILVPLGLSDTNFFHSENGTGRFTSSQLTRMAPGYNCSTSPCTPYAIGADDGPMYNPAGGLRSTPNDLMAWLQYQIGLGDAPQGIGRAIVTTHETPGAWGDDLATVPAGWHYKSGDIQGFESFMAFNPIKRLGVFVIGNSDQFSPKVPIGEDIVAALDTSTCMSQSFAPGMLGCPGTVNWTSSQGEDSLCPTSYYACDAAQWMAYSGGVAPTHSYWTSDDLKFNGTGSGACFASTTVGSECTANEPMRVCPATSPDPEGNVCNWTGCGYGTSSPDEYFGGCNGNATAGTLCCRGGSACAPGASRQTYAPGVEGCSGAVTWPNRDNLCAPGCAACSAAQYLTYKGGLTPSHHYWTSDDLKYSGTGTGACFASTTTGTECGGNSPMRICAPETTDANGNVCNWYNCGYGSDTPNDDFGGCVGNTTAGTLCCCNQ